jgi:hypothetical protein
VATATKPFNLKRAVGNVRSAQNHLNILVFS